MAILKCKICGGDLNVAEGQTVCECDYCGSRQTVPTLDSEKKLTVVVQQQWNENAAPLLERVFMFLEDGNWNSANEYCEKVLDIDPRNAEAYLGKLMAELKVKTREQLKNQQQTFENSINCQKALRFGNETLKREILFAVEHIKHIKEISKAADSYYNKKEYGKAFELYRQAAEAGYAHAQYELGVLYQNGQGTAVRYDSAMLWYQKSAAQNNALSWNNIGSLYSSGLGVPQNKTKALECYLRASSLNDGIGAMNAAFCYENGKGTPKDRRKAAYYYRLAVERGIKNAVLFNNLGVCYMDGIGVQRDYQKAREMFDKALKLGSTMATSNIALLKKHMNSR